MKKNFLLFGTIIISIFVISLTACPPGDDSILNHAALDTAISNANAAKTGVLISADGSDINTTNIWVTQEEMNALNAAITGAETARSQSTTQAEVDNAVNALNSFVDTFNNTMKKQGTKTLNADDLSELIEDAEALMESFEVSADGSNISPGEFWVTQQAKEDLQSAINSAKSKEESGDNNEITEAYAALLLAKDVFENSKQRSTQTIRWSFWGSQTRIDNAQLAIDLFTERTGIIVSVETQGVAEHFEKFLTEHIAGNAADVIQLGGHFSNLGIVDNGTTAPGVEDYLLPLTGFVSSGIIDISQLDDAAIQAGTRNGTLYALPLGINMPAMIYNKSALERAEAPLPNTSMTWEEFEDWMEEVKPLLPADTWVLTDYSIAPSSFMFFSYWAGDNGKPLYDGTNTQLTVEVVQGYFDLWADWRTKEFVPPAATSDEYSGTDEAAFIAGKTFVTMAWSNNLINYQDRTSDELGLIEFPNAAVNNGLWAQVSQMIGINAGSANGEAAARFINFRAIDPDAWAITGADPGFPSTSAARNAIATDSVSQKIGEYINTAGNHTSPVDPIIPNDGEFNSELRIIAQKAASGDITPEEAGQEVMELINRLIN